MMLRANDIAGSSSLTRRVEHPLARSCPLHLRRICGTCTHFEGHLRQAERGRCARIGHDPSPLKSAANCKFWARK